MHMARKGYQEPKEHIAGQMAQTTTVTGVVGTIENPSLWERIDAELRARDWNWITLAKKVILSRQRLVNVCRYGQCPEQTLLALCRVFDWTPTEVMKLEWSTTPDDDRSSKPTE